MTLIQGQDLIQAQDLAAYAASLVTCGVRGGQWMGGHGPHLAWYT